MLNFEGKWNENDSVIIWSRYKGIKGIDLAELDIMKNEIRPVNEGHIFAFYNTTNAAVFFEETGIDINHIEDPEDIIKDHKRQQEKPDVEIIPIRIYSAFVSFTEEDINLKEDPKMFMGEYTFPDTCMGVIYTGLQLYSTIVIDKIRSKYSFEFEPKEAGKKYEDFDKEDSVANHILHNYLIPMMDAHDKRKSDYMEKKKDLVNFCGGSDIFRDVLDLVEIIGEKGVGIDVDLNDAYLDKIDAIHKKDMDKIIDAYHRINELKENS